MCGSIIEGFKTGIRFFFPKTRQTQQSPNISARENGSCAAHRSGATKTKLINSDALNKHVFSPRRLRSRPLPERRDGDMTPLPPPPCRAPPFPFTAGKRSLWLSLLFDETSLPRYLIFCSFQLFISFPPLQPPYHIDAPPRDALISLEKGARAEKGTAVSAAIALLSSNSDN